MTIERESRRSDVYLGDGSSTALPFGFKVFLPTEIAVVLNEGGVERTLSHGHGCTVSLNAEQDVQPGGTVRLDTPLPPGSKAVVLSNVRPLQQVDLTNQGGFYPDVLNAVHDRLTMLIQQLMELQARTPQVPATDNVTGKELARQIVELSRSLPGIWQLLTSDEMVRLLAILEQNPQLRPTEFSSEVNSEREDVAASSKAVKTAYDKAVAAEAAAASAEGAVSNVNGKLGTKLDTSVFNEFKDKAATKEELEQMRGTVLSASQIRGKIELLPFPADALPQGWYHANGDQYEDTTPQGRALSALPDALKQAFRIVLTGTKINLPNFYHTDGRGYFLRASKTLGTVQDDAIRNIVGNLYFIVNGIMHQQPTGAFGYQSTNGLDTSGQSFKSGRKSNTYAFNAANVVPTANENRPLNIGLTPAIYLGV
ncbi:tail fiber protein [Neisseria subflava]|uniref:tail fiber protein n=1 Tax=Neisseria subflava TaxID=28449 RepID=UPI00280BFFD2|nr:tail fiber protein [Neisseria subflava]